MTPANVDITIDEVVLHGVHPVERAEFANALEAKLTTLIENAVIAAHPWSGRDESSRRASIIEVDGRRGADLGAAVATTVSELLTIEGRQ